MTEQKSSAQKTIESYIEHEQIATKLAVEIDELSDLPFKFNKPILKSCKTIDSFYSMFS